MRPTLLASTALLTLAAPLAAETPITTKITAPVRTATVNAGNPDSIRISSTGSVELLTGTAVTIDSNHGVINEGKIIVSNAAGGAGIVANAGTTGDITVATGVVITVDESYTPTDIDNDGDIDGPFATGSNRYGIRTLGAHTGKITQSGTITVEGNDSAGIWLGGPLTGNFIHDGKTTVLGDRSVGVHADAITGNVRLAGTVGAVGQGAIGAQFSGDVTGAVVVQGAISSTGYRLTTPPADTSKLDADDLLQGGSAVMIEGNVTGGIILAVPPRDNSTTDNDEDDDGIEDAKEGSAAVTTYGSAPAMVIGSDSRAIAVGPIAGSGTGFGVQIDGTVTGNGVYTGVAGNGLVIGGRGGAVTIAGGLGIAGAVNATAKDANATALRIGSAASVPEIRVSGQVAASGGSTATSTTTAIQIDAGANVPLLRNSGTIKATAGGTAATAVAVIDRSGTLTVLENSGTISASGAATDSLRNTAIDLTANTTGVTIRQLAVAAGVVPPVIAGNVLTGSGNDVFDVADGSVSGTINLGGGNDRLALSGDAVVNGKVLLGAGDDAVTLAGTSVLNGTVDFAGGGVDTITLSGSTRFSGSLLNAASASVVVNGGQLDIATPTTIGSLTVGANGTIIATLDKTAGAGTLFTVTGNASIATGATLQLKLASVNNAEGRYTLINAGTLTVGTGLVTKTDLIPFLYKAAVATTAPANQLAVDITRKTATELELNASQSSAYEAVYAAMGADAEIGSVFLNIRNGEVFRATVDQMLPDHAGGTFRSISLGSRNLARQIMDPAGPILQEGKLRISFEAAGWGGSKPVNTTQSFKYSGLGAVASAEMDIGLGFVGVDLSWMWNENRNGLGHQTVGATTYMVGGHWHGNWGGISAFARGGIGRVNLNSKRTFLANNGTKDIQRTATGKWHGTLTSFSAGISGEGGGSHFFFRPSVMVDYTKLSENGLTEDGGGTGFNLTIDRRISKELALEGGMTVGIDFMGMAKQDNNWFRVEAEGGRRQILEGNMGATTAHFGTAQPFTLTPEENRSGWYGRLRALGGNSDFQLGGELGAEDGNGRLGVSVRGILRMPL